VNRGEYVEKEQVSMSFTTTSNHPNVETITVTLRLAPGETVTGQDSFILESEVLALAASHIPTWARYIRDSGMRRMQ